MPVPNLAGRPAVLSLAEHLVGLRPVALPGVLVAKVPLQAWPLVPAVQVARHKIEVGLCPKRVAVRAPKRHRVLRVLLV